MRVVTIDRAWVLKWLRRMAGAGLLVGLLGLVVVLYARSAVSGAARGRVFANALDVPEREVALVLGCSRYLAGGSENRYFTYRIDAVTALYDAGRIKYVLVSGDNSRKEYDEPTDMKEALVARGIPEENIYCDYAGFRTLDSVVRAREVFQANSFVVVSQRFHVDRALYLARERGIEAWGYPAQDVEGEHGRKTKIREELARVKAVLDVKVLGKEPKFLGEPVPVGG